jgi:hypothetical protein
MTVSADITKRFLTDTDETGRHIVISQRTGRKYYVEPILGERPPQWGSASPTAGDKDFAHKKGDGKYTGAVKEDESLITEDNGFVNIKMLEKGTSPMAYIDHIDATYPDKV